MTEIISTITALDFQGLLNTGLLALGAFAGFMGALYAFFLLVPGDQPDKTIKAIWDFTTRFSKK